MTGLILGALYMMWAYERVMWGPITHTINRTIADLTAREIAVVAPLIVLMLLLGLYPKPILSRMEPSVAELLDRIHATEAQQAHSSQYQLARFLPISKQSAAK